MNHGFKAIDTDIQNMKSVLIALNKAEQQINAVITLDKIQNDEDRLPVYKPEITLDIVHDEYKKVLNMLMKTMIDVVEGNVYDKYDTEVFYLSWSNNKIFYNNELVYELSIDNVDDFTIENIQNSYLSLIKPEIDKQASNLETIFEEIDELTKAKIIESAMVIRGSLHVTTVKIHYNDFSSSVNLKNSEYFKGKLALVVKTEHATKCRFIPERLIGTDIIGHNSKIAFVPGLLDLHAGKFGVDTIYNDIVRKEIQKVVDIIQYNYSYQLKCICKEDYVINNDCYYRHVKSFDVDGKVYNIYIVRYAGKRAIFKLFDDADECITGRKYRKLMAGQLSKEEIVAASNFL